MSHCVNYQAKMYFGHGNQQMVTAAPVLQFYDVTKEVTIQCDASSLGLGAVLMKEGHPIAYGSKTVTATDRNYAQIGKECLVIALYLHAQNLIYIYIYIYRT